MNARCHEQLGSFCGFSGSHACVMKIAMSDAKPTTAKSSTAQKYRSHVISSLGSMPVSR